ncbi:MAG: hypothetical protein WCS20_08080 [Alphaproteobacteria bacterium]
MTQPARNGWLRSHLPALVLLGATLAFFASPIVTPPFNGYDPAMFPVLVPRPAIQPAGYAFAIWGPIFLWLTAHAIFGLWRRNDSPAWLAPRLPLTLAILLGAVWLFVAPSYPIVATLVIVAMAALSLTAFLRADQVTDRWILSAPLAIFAGWLTAAAAVSTGVVLAGYGVLSNTTGALLLLGVVLGLALIVQSRKPAMPVYGATVVWALIGIVMANRADLPLVSTAALLGAVVLGIQTVILARR